MNKEQPTPEAPRPKRSRKFVATVVGAAVCGLLTIGIGVNFARDSRNFKQEGQTEVTDSEPRLTDPLPDVAAGIIMGGAIALGLSAKTQREQLGEAQLQAATPPIEA